MSYFLRFASSFRKIGYEIRQVHDELRGNLDVVRHGGLRIPVGGVFPVTVIELLTHKPIAEPNCPASIRRIARRNI